MVDAPHILTPLESALQCAGRGWRVFPVGRDKVPLVKWKKGATTSTKQIERWWRRWPDANVGIVTGITSGIAVLDVDGAKGVALLAAYGGSVATGLVVTTGRPDGGRHGYFGLDRETKGIPLDGLELKADGQFVVGPGSLHASGRRYAWQEPAGLLAPLPAELVAWMRAQKGQKPKSTAAPPNPDAARLGPRPAWMSGSTRLGERAASHAGGLGRRGSADDVLECLERIHNHDLAWDRWKEVGMAVWAALDGSAEGLELFEWWSSTSRKWKEGGAEQAWREATGSPPVTLGMQSLIFWAREESGLPDWLPSSRSARPVAPPNEPAGPAPETPAADMNGHAFPLPQRLSQQTFDNPLIELNKRYSVIGDLGGKCLVMSWVPSKVDDTVKVPSFQSFKSFSERYAHQYIKIGTGDEEEIKQLGPYWLKWTKRKSYEGIDLVPEGEPVLPGNVLNLWSGFAVTAAPGAWGLMKDHIQHVLASGDREAAAYIARFAAWAVQHPGERAEVALVFRGGKGSGKGTFANALRRIFGQHGLQIFNSKHLVGSFNGHLRNCLLLFADEAFWAGDKQGESVLKGLITESALMIEQKGVDASPWRNRLHVIMAANAEWVVPASRGERRYAVFDVSSERIGDRAYFAALHREMHAGGLAAMLWDLQRVDLGGWHPREIIETAALQEQKDLSLSPLRAWWEDLLQNGLLPHETNAPNESRASRLLDHFREHAGPCKEANATAIGRYLSKAGCEGLHGRTGNFWRFPPLLALRRDWTKEMGTWKWKHEISDWRKMGG